MFLVDLLVPFGPLLRQVDGKVPFANWPELFWRAIPVSFLVYWLFSLIPFVGIFAYTLILVPLSAYLHIKLKGISNRNEKVRIYLWYFVVIVIGFGGLWSFVGHTFLANSVANDIGWLTGSPFQTELAFYHLGFGIAGLLAIWIRGNMVTGLVIAKSVFWYGAAFVHVKDAVLNQNYSPLNIGAPLIGDIVIPTVLLTLLFITVKNNFQEKEESKFLI